MSTMAASFVVGAVCLEAKLPKFAIHHHARHRLSAVDRILRGLAEETLLLLGIPGCQASGTHHLHGVTCIGLLHPTIADAPLVRWLQELPGQQLAMLLGALDNDVALKCPLHPSTGQGFATEDVEQLGYFLYGESTKKGGDVARNMWKGFREAGKAEEAITCRLHFDPLWSICLWSSHIRLKISNTKPVDVLRELWERVLDCLHVRILLSQKDVLLPVFLLLVLQKGPHHLSLSEGHWVSNQPVVIWFLVHLHLLDPILQAIRRGRGSNRSIECASRWSRIKGRRQVSSHWLRLHHARTTDHRPPATPINRPSLVWRWYGRGRGSINGHVSLFRG